MPQPVSAPVVLNVADDCPSNVDACGLNNTIGDISPSSLPIQSDIEMLNAPVNLILNSILHSQHEASDTPPDIVPDLSTQQIALELCELASDCGNPDI